MNTNILKMAFGAAVLLGMSSCSTTEFAIASGDENLTTLTKVTDNEEPCGNPYGGDEGGALFFAARENGEYWNIYKKENPFSAAITQKTSGKNLNYEPVFCAGTGKIAFRCQNEGSSTSDIFIMSDAKGKALSQITESSDAYEGKPSFSPDGKYVVFHKISYSYYKASGGFLWFGTKNIIVVKNSEIWLKNLTSGETVLLGNGYQPAFSPDGEHIAYVKYSSDAESCSIWTMELDGSNLMQITDAKKGFAYSPCWSPDGSKLVFSSLKKDKKDYDLYIIDADGNNLKQLTKNKSYDGEPYWTSDNYIYFTSDRGGKAGNCQIWRFKYND